MGRGGPTFRDGKANGEGDGQGATLADVKGGVGHHAAQPLSDAARLGQGDVGQGDEKLFPADARQKIARPQVLAQAFGHLDQDRIAHGMAKAVIHRFELVNVGDQNGEDRPAGLGSLSNCLHPRQTIAAVVQPGERVNHREAQTVGD
jgi:hypothetical protein